LKLSKIRDVESNGMLCAEDELGLGESHAGIMVLNPDAIPGTPMAEYLAVETDVQIEIGLTPNRADAMGHIGVARDLIAYSNCHENCNDHLILPQLNELQVTASLPMEIEVQDNEKCVRYSGITIADVTVSESPSWLKNRLKVVGLSPINNIVDATNYVMRELGVPIHAFDADKVGKKIMVRVAKPGEKLVTLDDVERELSEDDLVIANENEALCIAGVFGGKDSGISAKTKNIFIEVAYFNPVSVRKTAKKFGLSTDASFRFERGVDIDLIPYVLKRVTHMILELAGGKIGMNSVDLYPKPMQRRGVTLRTNRLNSTIGHVIPTSMVVKILQSLDIEITAQNETEFQLLIPNYRVDVDREIDVIEEVLRIYGFNQVPLPEKLNTSLVVTQKPDLERLTVSLAEFLAGSGFAEMMNNSLSSPLYSEKLTPNQYPIDNAVHLLNPLSQELAVMRQSLVFQALETVAYNQNRQANAMRLFEFGKTYQQIDGKYVENKRLLLVGYGQKTEESWTEGKADFSFFTLKGLVNNLFARLGMEQLLQENELPESELFTDGLTLNVLKEQVGTIGWVSSKVLKHFGIKQAVYVADLDWDAVVRALKFVKTQYKELPKTFEVRRDYSLLLDSSVKFAQLVSIAKKVNKNLLQRVGLFDVYEGKNLPEGKKSYAVSFVFQDAENTLKDAQIDPIMLAIRKEFETQLGAELR
jgi:phenylalanyl-tRNA synthetase beta chain